MSVAVANPYRYRQTIGMFVEFGRGMSNPYDVAPVEDGRLFVLNRSNIFDAPVGGQIRGDKRLGRMLAVARFVHHGRRVAVDSAIERHVRRGVPEQSR